MTFRAAAAALRAQQGVVVRPGALPLPEHRAHPLQHRAGLSRKRLLVQRRVDLRRRPAGKRPALRRLPIRPVLQQMDGQPRAPAARPARRARFGHLDPHFREPPRLVLRQLAPARVGGVVHLQHHVREVMLADRQHRPRQPGARRVQVHHLVRLHDEARLAVRVALGQVGAAEGLYRRPAHRGDALGQLPHATRGAFVVGADRIADPGGLGDGVPVFEHASRSLQAPRAAGEPACSRGSPPPWAAGRRAPCPRAERDRRARQSPSSSNRDWRCASLQINPPPAGRQRVSSPSGGGGGGAFGSDRRRSRHRMVHDFQTSRSWRSLLITPTHRGRHAEWSTPTWGSR